MGNSIKMSKFMAWRKNKYSIQQFVRITSKLQEIFDQTDEVIQMLEEIKLLSPSGPEFKAKVEQLRTAVRAHINQGERYLPKLKNNFQRRAAEANG